MLSGRGAGIWEWLGGYVEITVDGIALESFINLAAGQGIRFFNLKRPSDQVLLAFTPVKSFSRLRPLARRTRCRVRIRKRCGLPFFLARFQRRRFLLAGVITGMILVYLLSSLVWSVKVEGTVRNSPREILKKANQMGLRTGVPRWQIDWKEVEQGLKSAFPDIAFVGIEMQGTQVTIRVVEKVLLPGANGAVLPIHLTAARDGVIKEILVITGEPQVRPGDMVKRGQILISGIVPPPGSGSRVPLPGVVIPPPQSTEPQAVRAQGIVKAIVWYRAYGESPLAEESWERTGHYIYRLVMSFQNKEFVLGKKKIPYSDWQAEKQKEWRFSLPGGVIRKSLLEEGGEGRREEVVLRWEKVEELFLSRCEYTLEEAQQLAVSQARTQIEQKRLPGSRLISERIELLSSEEGDKVRVQVIVEAEEDIGEELRMN